jgi:branched-chain amino acid transport system permease protein
VAALFTLSANWRLAIINTLIGVVLCLSLVVVTGFVGQISLVQLTLAGCAGFALSKFAVEQHVPFPFSPLLAALVAAVIGALVAVPALRIRGVQLAIVTLAAAVAIDSVVFSNPAVLGGIGSNAATIDPPRLFGIKFGPADSYTFGDMKIPNPFFGVFCLIVTVGLALLVVALRRSKFGYRMLAVRSNERAAAAAGVNVAATKIIAFTIAAFIAGLGGVLSAYQFEGVSPVSYDALLSVALLAFAYMGGITSVTGAVIAGFLVTDGLVATALSDWFRVPSNYMILIGGLGLIVTAVLNPEGIAGGVGQTWRSVRRRLGRVRRTPAGGGARPDQSRAHQITTPATPEAGGPP